jgi:hypothetical protein
MISRSAVSSLIALGVVGLFAFPGSAADFCVATSGELQAALDAAEANGEDDTIRLIRGTYVVPPNGFFYGAGEPYGLTIEGDYSEFMSDCIRWTPATPWDTILTGDNLYPVMRLDSLSSTYHTVRVESLTFQNGLYTGSGAHAGGLSIVGGAGTKSHIEVENCLFIANEGQNQAGALAAASDGTMMIVNNFFIGNQGGAYATAALTNNGIGVSSPCVEIVNNTVAGNISSTGHGGIRIGGGCQLCVVDNNILYGNENADLILETTLGLACRLYHNDLQDYSGSPHSMIGNMNVDPGYVGYLNYRLAPGSPLVDAGFVRSGSPIPNYDMDALPRIVGPAIDIGAFERQTLFDDGFEIGSTSNWSATVP